MCWQIYKSCRRIHNFHSKCILIPDNENIWKWCTLFVHRSEDSIGRMCASEQSWSYTAPVKWLLFAVACLTVSCQSLPMKSRTIWSVEIVYLRIREINGVVDVCLRWCASVQFESQVTRGAVIKQDSGFFSGRGRGRIKVWLPT